METFVKVKQIALNNPEGFTFSILENSQIEKGGFVVAMKLTQNHFSDEGLKKVIEIAKQSTFLIGGWFNQDNNLFYYDCVMIVKDKETAIKLGKANDQLAIFDLDKSIEIAI